MELYSRTKKVILTPTKAISNTNYKMPLMNITPIHTIYLSNLSQFIVIDGNVKYNLLLFRNIHLNDTSMSLFKPDMNIYNRDYFFSLDTFRVVSYPRLSVLFGNWLNGYSFQVDVTNSTINGYKKVLNIEYVAGFSNHSYNSNTFTYFEDQLFTYKFYPKYERILYPLTGNKHQPHIYSEFELKNKETTTYIIPPECKDGTYITEWDFVINRPKFMFSTDNQNWYTWDFTNQQWTQQTPDNNSYFTFNEFLTKGQTYTQYLEIPDSAFESNEMWYVMTNNYILGFVIRPEYFDEILGSDKFMVVYYDVGSRDNVFATYTI